MSTAVANSAANNVSNVSPRLPTTPRETPRTPTTPSASVTQPILTTGSVPSEVTHLFRTKRVSEIRQFESRIRAEAEDKSESLRHLLGTRYRDLLSAADRISEMCEGSKTSVRDGLQTVYETSCQLRDDLNARATTIDQSPRHVDVQQPQQQPATPTTPTTPTTPNPKDADLARRRSVHAVGSRLKHIVDSPEVLYACLEAGELYEAASRYVVAQRNFNAIVEDPTDEGSVASRFAHARWKLVSAFRSQIITAAERRLVTSGLDSHAYARVFAAIVLLQSTQCDVISIVEKLLSARTTWLVEVRHRHASNDASAAMREIAIVVRDTIRCMAQLFWKSDTDDDTDDDTDNSNEEDVESLLLKVDKSCANLIVQARERGGFNATIIAWTSNVRTWLQDNGDSLLSTATNSHQVALALKSVDEILSHSDWLHYCQVALQRSPDFVFDIFKPFISARAAVVAEECVQLAVKRVLEDIGNAWDEISGLSDIGKGMWTTMSAQAVNMGNNLNPDGAETNYLDRLRSSAARDLDEERDVARMLVYNGAVAGVVDTFELCLKEALSDVKILAQRVSSVVSAFDSAMGSNVPTIFDELQKRVGNMMKESTEQTVDENIFESDEQRRNIDMERCLFAARTATALADADCIADALKFISQSSLAMTNGDDNVSNRNSTNSSRSTGLVELQVRAASVSGMGYSVWAKLLCDGLAKGIEHDLTWERRLVVEMGWVGDSTQSLDDEDNYNLSKVDAAVRYPTTASTAIVNMLLKACKAASKAGGFALPVEAVEFVRDAMTKVVVDVYRKVLKVYTDSDKTTAIHDSNKNDQVDKAVMQLLFDIQCLQILFGDISVNEQAINSMKSTSLKELESEIQARIDPIDLASCRKSLRQSVSNYVARTGTLFGPVARRRDGRTAWAGVIRVSAHSSTMANLVSLAPSVPRFTYLPAPMPSTYTSSGAVGIHAKAVVGALRNEAAAASAAAVSSAGNARKRESVDTSVAGYASKVSESVGRFGRGFFESLTRKVA